jgi:hypothetical protein
MVENGRWRSRLFIVLASSALTATPALAAEGVKAPSEFLFVAS